MDDFTQNVLVEIYKNLGGSLEKNIGSSQELANIFSDFKEKMEEYASAFKYLHESGYISGYMNYYHGSSFPSTVSLTVNGKNYIDNKVSNEKNNG